MIDFNMLLSSLDSIVVLFNDNNEIVYCNKPQLIHHFQTDSVDLTQNQETVTMEGIQYQIIQKKITMNEQNYRLVIYDDIVNPRQDQLSQYDDLTGLLNKRSLYSELEKLKFECSSLNQKIAVAFCDIDYFKQVNDTIGHVEADKILKHIGTILQNNIRGNDLAARFGGEEFLLVLSNCTIEDGFKRIERIRALFERQVYFCQDLKGKPQQLHVTLSFGLSTCEGSKTIEKIIKEADSALYISKQKGRNQTTIYQADESTNND